ncbi:MAG: glycosyltransferase [Dysgonamonadaceae bacterium]|jgi:cellulose synthase/poly-beta-1,6-N-acetylglucosamine synthase-like glycosyltransferase|nr:glycosyltransferase [Dysgonamonadaceae bacterium]
MYFSIFEIFLLSGIGLFFLLQVLYFFCYLWKPVRYFNLIRKGEISIGTATPPVSVIICAQNESENLNRFLPCILEQDYPQYEVIVVNEGSTDESEDVLCRLGAKYKHLYHTYIPGNVKLSKKKLAITVGIKAAKYDILLFTNADCCPVSGNWIRCMARHFDGETAIVTGYGAMPTRKGFVGKSILFDTLIVGLRAFSLALMNKPYTAKGANMAYRKDLFLKGKGFQPYLYLQDGEDDLFVNTEATATNTRIEMSPESITVRDFCNFKTWTEMKIRQLTTRNYYRLGPQLLWNVESFTRFAFWAFAGTILAFTALTPQWIISAVAMFFLVLSRWLLFGLVINKAAKILQQNEKFYWSIPLLEITRPFLNVYFHINHYFRKKSDYTWRM